MFPFCIYVIMAVSLNLTVGILGELSLGHAGFMCVGAFAGALFSKVHEGSPLTPLLEWSSPSSSEPLQRPCSASLSESPVLRLRGDYLAIVTLAFW